ncbi:MAG: sigma-70 family RNA polymerase sigma factor [Acidobacteria bacterium]|nr:sigma-70 family RNA polymerase sigma factor [Acidobacteriota bacterium]
MVTAQAATVADAAPDPVLDRARAGDEDAFGELVRTNQRLVYSLAWHMLRDRALAEDVAQEVFLQLSDRLDDIGSRAHLLHWLRRVTAHRAIDQARRQRARPAVPLDETPTPHLATPDVDPWVTRTLRRLVASLPPRARLVVVLRYQEDLDPLEIARLLDVPINTVKSLLRRSLAVLRRRATALQEVR